MYYTGYYYGTIVVNGLFNIKNIEATMVITYIRTIVDFCYIWIMDCIHKQPRLWLDFIISYAVFNQITEESRSHSETLEGILVGGFKFQLVVGWLVGGILVGGW